MDAQLSLEGFENSILPSMSGDDSAANRAVGGSERRSQELIRRLFSLRLSENSLVRRRLTAKGCDAVLRDMNSVAQRHGVHMMTMDAFHIALSEVLAVKGEMNLPPSESRMIFNLFDDNRSGIVDLDEFEQGVRLLLQDESVVLTTHCRYLICDPHTPIDGAIAILEIDLMFDATLHYHSEAGPFSKGIHRLKEAMHRTRLLMWKAAHHGQIDVSMFRAFVSSEPYLHDAVLALPMSGDGQDARKPPPSPDPLTVVGALSSVHLRGHRSGGRSHNDEEADGGDNLASSAQKGAKASADSPPEKAQQPSTTNTSHAKGIAYDALDHFSLKADEFIVGNTERQRNATETGNPEYYSLRDQVYRRVEGEPDIPIFNV